MYKTAILYGLVLFFLLSCNTNPSQNDSNKKSSSLSNSSQSYTQTFPKYAKGFSVIYGEDYKLLSIHNPQKENSDTTTYLLSNGSSPLPKNLKYDLLIKTPIKSIVCTSTTHIALASSLNAENYIIGMSGTDFVSNEIVRKNIKNGDVKEVGNSGQLNKEQVIILEPDILMVTGGYGQSNDKNIYQKAGVNLISNYEWLETHPLGRAEWIKFLAYFLNIEEKANSTFEDIEKRYLVLKQLTQNIKHRPKVITGLSFNGSWYVPGGKSFAAKMSFDAGVEYFYSNDSTTGSRPLDFEVIYNEGLIADYWINPGSAKSFTDILSKESRTADFKAIKNKKVYNNNRLLNSKGWNDYYESSVVNPHIVLADLIKIFHPNLLSEHNLHYYKQLQ